MSYYCAVMIKALDYLVEKFSEHRSKIIVLFNTDEDFRALCEDYLTSAQVLGGDQEKSLKSRETQNEYSQVYAELEKEIMKRLGTHEKTE